MTDQPLDCVGAMKQLFDYLDGELTPDREAADREMRSSDCARNTSGRCGAHRMH